MINIYGKKGKAWLEELPELVACLSLKLGLHNLKEITTLSYHYVLSGFQGNKPIILKLGLDHQTLNREAFALKCFSGFGAIKLLSEDDGILLLERAIPGISLKTYFPDREQEAIQIATKLMKKLHQANIPEHTNFPHIKDWLAALNKNSKIPRGYLQKAKKLRDHLLQTSKQDVLLHGDLHHDNILQNGDDWLVIDPKGVMGEPAYEVAAFIRNPMPNLLNINNVSEMIENRIKLFANLLDIPVKRILNWCFVQAVLAWIWAIEDGCDTNYFEQLIKIFDNYLFQ